MNKINDAVLDAIDAADLAADVLREVAAVISGAEAVLSKFESPAFSVPENAKRLLCLAADRCDVNADSKLTHFPLRLPI